MPHRPGSITVIGWTLILFGLSLALAYTILVFQTGPGGIAADVPPPTPVEAALVIVNFVANVAIGALLLQGKRWAPLMFVGYSVAIIAISVAIHPSATHLVNVVLFAVAAWFLFRPRAREFFAGPDVHMFAGSPPPPRQWASYAAYFLASGMLFSSAMSMFFDVPKGPSKPVMLVLASLPAAITLLMARSLSVDPKWRRELGVVFTAVAVVGALSVAFMALASLDPEAAEQIVPQQAVAYDFVSGPLCLAMLGGVGLRLLARDRAENSRRMRPSATGPNDGDT